MHFILIPYHKEKVKSLNSYFVTGEYGHYFDKDALPCEKDHIACSWKQVVHHEEKPWNNSSHRIHDFFLLTTSDRM